MDRRQFISSVSALISIPAAGCSSNSSTDSPNSGTTENTEDPEMTTGSSEVSTGIKSQTPAPDANGLIDDTIELPEGENLHADFSVSSPAIIEYDFTVENNIEIDLFVLSLGDFQQYQSGQSFSTIQTVDGSEATGDVEVPRGNYYVVIDHSDRGPISPPGQFEQVSATIDVTISYIN
ncbi:hypothetical protein [Halorientalis pallida]|uniref:Uncharacterized protein n=1 Tax=Halorientalis pallida TaxID=2479928 RepID=A0A498KZQ2_9EURY|nr:hypothetical protein [Halorientalis pallida]RXK48676.1 hypothetical protein EAF64_13470 [Halorientalis pallida]